MAGPRTLRTFCELLSYPGEQVIEACELLYIILQSELPDAATQIARFGSYVELHEPWELEEAYTSTFDVDPTCALEVGWHLFGEEYDRGLMLVRMREELRKYGLSESCELPDHLTHVLPLIAAMPEDEAQRFVKSCVQPAVLQMREALSKSESPYRSVIEALALVIQSVWGDGKPINDGSGPYRADGRTIPEGVDLLHAYPAADVHFGCGSGCSGSCGGEHAAAPLIQLGGVDSVKEIH